MKIAMKQWKMTEERWLIVLPAALMGAIGGFVGTTLAIALHLAP